MNCWFYRQISASFLCNITGADGAYIRDFLFSILFSSFIFYFIIFSILFSILIYCSLIRNKSIKINSQHAINLIIPTKFNLCLHFKSFLSTLKNIFLKKLSTFQVKCFKYHYCSSAPNVRSKNKRLHTPRLVLSKLIQLKCVSSSMFDKPFENLVNFREWGLQGWIPTIDFSPNFKFRASPFCTAKYYISKINLIW